LFGERRGCGSTRKFDERLRLAQSWNQIQTLQECLCCHIYCAQRCSLMFGTVAVSRAVSLVGSPASLHALCQLHHTATRYNALQHTATHCITRQHTATHGNTLQHTASHAAHFIILRHTATCCNTLQHTATHYNTTHVYLRHCPNL